MNKEEIQEPSMIGAIVGDIAGSRFEWHNRKSKRFTLMKGRDESRHPCHVTDDTVMTLAVAEAIMSYRKKEMREFWTTVGAMVLGYFMYLGLRAIFRKGK